MSQTASLPGTACPSLGEFRVALDASFFRSLGNGIATLQGEFGSVYATDFDRHLQLLRAAHPAQPWPAWAANGYVSFNRMVLKEEIAFRKSRAYSAGAEDMDRIVAEVYDNEAVMTGYYLVGLYLTYFIWPHHYRMLRYFRQEFLGAAAGEATRFAEWGVGHGLLSLSALARWPRAEGWIFDLSAHSLDFARALLGAAGQAPRCGFVQGDVLAADQALPVVDRLICSEVLEHVPNPQAVLARTRQALAPGGRAFLTAAVNAPQADHVFLYRSAEEVFAQAAEAGLKVRSHLSVVHPNRMGEAEPPAVVGMIVEPA